MLDAGDRLLLDFGLLAVVPGLLGPLHSLMLLLPQILLGVVLAARSLINPMVWRNTGRVMWHAVSTRPVKCATWLTIVVSGVWFVCWSLVPVGNSNAISNLVVDNDNWSTFHANSSRWGTQQAPADLLLSSQPPVRWKFRDSLILERRPFASSPAVAGSRVVIGGDNFTIYCLDLETGQLQWTYQARWPVFSSPAIWDGRVYVGEGLHEQTDSRLYCLDLTTGKLQWSFQTNSHTESSPTVTDGKVYFGAGDDGVYCLNALSGEMIWQYSGAHVDSAPLIFEDRVYFGSGYGFQGVLCVSARDGELIWKRSYPAPVWGAPSASNGRLYVAVGNGDFYESAPEPYGEVRCLEPATGKDIWRYTNVRDGVLTSVAVRENHAVFGSRDGACYALDATTGKLLWREDIDAPILSSPAIAGQHVLFGADDGLFHCLRLSDGREAWRIDTSDDMMLVMEEARVQSSPAVTDGRIVFGASNGNVYCLEAELGQATAATVVSETGYRSRLMRAADFLVVGLVDYLARFTGNYGFAIIVAAVMLKLLLLPLDWQQLRQTHIQQQLLPTIERLRHEYIDYRVHRYELRERCAEAGIRPWRALCFVALQLPLFVVLFLVLQATPVFANKPFLWISDLSVPDRAGQAVYRSLELNILPFVLAVSVWSFSKTLQPVGRRYYGGAGFAWILMAGGIGLLTYRWPSALVLFTIALLWMGILQHQIVSAVDRRAVGAGEVK